jgi:hypothetical protein
MEKVRRLLVSVLSFAWVEKAEGVVAAVLLAASILIVSGLVFVSISNVGPFYGRRIFAPTQTIQTIGEFIVIATYYALGTVGLLLFYMASTGRFTGRASRYAAAGSTLLLLLSALGLLAGFAEKL